MTKIIYYNVGILPNIGNYIYTILGLHIMFCKFMLQNVNWKCHKIRYDVLVS
jgi:hypothetical protein